MNLKLIRTEDEYTAALQEAERLISRDPEPGTTEAERLELLTVLIEDYEKKQFVFDEVSPVEAIEFRMAEQGLRQKDLVPFIGSRSRVSEVLAGKRPLTVQMIRALSTGLGIPAELLLSEEKKEITLISPTKTLEWDKFPVREMEKRGWFVPLRKKRFSSSAEMVKAFIEQLDQRTEALVLFRRTFRGEQIEQQSYYSVLAWAARVLIRAKELGPPKTPFEHNRISVDTLRDLAQLSWFDEGPRLAVEFLAKHGIALIIEPRLPNSLLDGAAFLLNRAFPVIGMTLRYDRVDHFWFTLLHECAHVWKHLNSTEEAFVDRLEGSSPTQQVEKEANRIARESFIARSVWRASSAFLAPSAENIQRLADDLHIHPAIVAGRFQYETGRYDMFRGLLGQGGVRKWFKDASFSRITI